MAVGQQCDACDDGESGACPQHPDPPSHAAPPEEPETVMLMPPPVVKSPPRTGLAPEAADGDKETVVDVRQYDVRQYRATDGLDGSPEPEPEPSAASFQAGSEPPDKPPARLLVWVTRPAEKLRGHWKRLPLSGKTAVIASALTVLGVGALSALGEEAADNTSASRPALLRPAAPPRATVTPRVTVTVSASPSPSAREQAGGEEQQEGPDHHRKTHGHGWDTARGWSDDYGWNADEADPYAQSTSDGSSQGSPSTGCTVGYDYSDESAGHWHARLHLGNMGSEELRDWTVTWQFPDDRYVTTSWGGTADQDGSSVTFTPDSDNSVLWPGSSVTFGIEGDGGDPAAPPTDFSLDETDCEVS